MTNRPMGDLADLHKNSIFSALLKSAVNQTGRERKGPPEIIQKFCLRKWPISSADFPMTPMERAEHHSGPCWEKDFGAISGGPFFSRPLCSTADQGNSTGKSSSTMTLHKENAVQGALRAGRYHFEMSGFQVWWLKDWPPCYHSLRRTPEVSTCCM